MAFNLVFPEGAHKTGFPCDNPVVLSKTDFARERGLYYSTGRQDARNVMDPNEIADEIGVSPTVAQIAKWLEDVGFDLDEFIKQNDLKELGVTRKQAGELLASWRQGWANYAVEYMKTFARDKARRDANE